MHIAAPADSAATQFAEEAENAETAAKKAREPLYCQYCRIRFQSDCRLLQRPA